MATNLPAISPKKAIENIAKAYPAEAAALTNVINNNIVALGTGDAFALRDKDGEIRCFKQNFTLSAKEGTLIQPVPGGPHVISAQGYEQWAGVAGACVIFPSEVLVDGKWMQNPFIQRDPQNRRILCIYARAIAFRFSDKGIPQVSDWTTIFDTPSYRMIDLLAKAKQLPQAFRLLPDGMEPDADGTWAKYPFDESTNLWVNTAHNEALSWFSQILNREKKAIDFAQTFAKRNALKHLSGLQKAPGPEWTIPVLCWRPTGGNIIKWDATQYANLQGRVGKMISGDKSEFKQIDMAAGSERTSETLEETDGIIDQTDTEDNDRSAIDVEKQETKSPILEPEKPKTETKKPKPETKVVKKETPAPENKKAPTAEEQKVMKNLAVMAGNFPQEFEQACANIGVTIESYTLVNAPALIDQMNKILNG
ncbi:MAG: hypothetical protein WC450_09875 [Candidatus Omnitrophota bacterium]|jgi:hypothetical protein